MKLKRKLKALLASLTLISFLATQGLAQAPNNDGKYTRLKLGETAPFDAWCFDDQASGTIFTTLKNYKESCQLEINRQLGLQKASHELQIGKLNIRYNTLKKQTDELFIIKDQEIRDLEAAALKRPNQYWYLWASGGVAIGVAATMLLVSVSTK